MRAEVAVSVDAAVSVSLRRPQQLRARERREERLARRHDLAVVSLSGGSRVARRLAFVEPFLLGRRGAMYYVSVQRPHRMSQLGAVVSHVVVTIDCSLALARAIADTP